VLVKKNVVKGAIKAIDLIKNLSPDEKAIAKEVLRYIRANPTAAYTDIYITGAGEYRNKQFRFFDVKGNLLTRGVGPWSVKRIVDVLLLKGLIIDPKRLEKLKETIKKKEKVS
jgi:hypothetical protein